MATNVMSSEEMKDTVHRMVSYSDTDEYSDWVNENPTYIDLKGNEAVFKESQSLLTSPGNLTIKTSGTYVLSGIWEDGQIIVDAEDEGTVKLVLNGVEIKSEQSAPVFIKNAGNTVISLADGTVNTLTDADAYILDESAEGEPDAALFSKDNLTINGTGSLRVVGNMNDGIKSKDDLKITGGTIEVEAIDDGIVGRDVVAVRDGDITIQAGGDGIKSTNDEKEGKGGIAIEGGSFDIVAGSDGVQAATSLYVLDGSFLITAGGGSPESIDAGEQRPDLWGAASVAEEEDTPSTKGMKAAEMLAVGGGTIRIDSLDDAMHSNDEIVILDGTLELATGDDGIHADSSVVTSGGTINISKSYEGIEGNRITIIDGEIHMVSSDDGINVSGGNDGSGFGMQGDRGMPPGRDGTQSSERPDPPAGNPPTAGDPPNDMGDASQAGDPPMNMEERPMDKKNSTEQTGENLEGTSEDDENNGLIIQGGYISVITGGDGLDSNGFIEMTGGTVIVNGPTDNGNGSLDYDKTFDISGGTLLTAGSSGMAMAPSDSSSQNSILMTFSESKAVGTIVHLVDGEGNNVATFAPEAEYTSVLISSEKLKKGETYTLYAGGEATGTVKDGHYSEADYQNGVKVVDFTITESVTWLNEEGVTTGGNGFPGGGFAPGDESNRPQGQRQEGMFDGLDEETKLEVQGILTEMREGTMSQEEATEKLKELGVTLPTMGNRK